MRCRTSLGHTNAEGTTKPWSKSNSPNLRQNQAIHYLSSGLTRAQRRSAITAFHACTALAAICHKSLCTRCFLK